MNAEECLFSMSAYRFRKETVFREWRALPSPDIPYLTEVRHEQQEDSFGDVSY